jgi:hypothetical protein
LKALKKEMEDIKITDPKTIKLLFINIDTLVGLSEDMLLLL